MVNVLQNGVFRLLTKTLQLRNASGFTGGFQLGQRRQVQFIEEHRNLLRTDSLNPQHVDHTRWNLLLQLCETFQFSGLSNFDNLAGKILADARQLCEIATCRRQIGQRI